MKTLRVRVKPGTSRRELRPGGEGEDWTACLTSPPVDGKANRELQELIAAHFGCARSRVVIKHGAGARIKLITVDID